MASSSVHRTPAHLFPPSSASLSWIHCPTTIVVVRGAGDDAAGCVNAHIPQRGEGQGGDVASSRWVVDDVANSRWMVDDGAARKVVVDGLMTWRGS